MKKILAILLSTAMLVAMFAVMAVPTSAAALAFDGTFDKASSGDATSWIATEAYSGVEWRYATSFKPSTAANTYEVVAKANPEGTDTGVAPLDVPANGFVYITGPWGTDTNGKAIFAALSVGDIVEINGLDLANKTLSDDATLEVIGAIPDYDVEGNVALGKSYTTTDPYRMGGADVQWGYDASKDPTYPDETGKTLTDGKLPKERSYLDTAWVGLHDGTPDAAELGFSWVKIDLEGTYTLNKVVAYVAPNLGDGVTFPAWMGLVGYDNEGNAFDIGEFVIPADDGNAAYLAVEMDLSDVVADAIEVRIARSGFTFISEVAAYGVAGGEYPVEGENSDDNSGENSDENSGENSDENSNENSDENSNENSDENSNENSDENSNENSNESSEGDNAPSIEDIMGPVVEDAGFEVVIEAPETYVPGETFSVNFVIKNITNADGFDTFEFVVEYDQTKLELAEELSGKSISIFNGFAEWEELCVVNEDGSISVTAGTAGGDTGADFTFAKNDGEISFTIDFTAKAEATGDALIYVCNECPMGYYTDGNVEAQGNGDYAYIAATEKAPEATEPGASEDQPTPGDASSMIFFAIIALVAIAGSAVVIKTRR